MYKKIISFLLPSILLVFGIFYSFRSENGSDIILDARTRFKSEENYLRYMSENVRFRNVNLNFVKIQKGDNFWKIARDYNINIDTLIGANLFWEDLRARTSQTVIVPSEPGSIVFLEDPSDIKGLAESRGVDVSDIEVQNLPFLYSLTAGFKGERMPLAVFIRDAKPDVKNMTASLSGKFKLRQMFRSPLGGRLSSFYGNRKHPIFRKMKFHDGLDIAAPHGTFIGAARDGEVVNTGWMGGYGKAVVIMHDNGYKTMYGHMSVVLAKKGQRVKAGKVIGRVGSTGLSTGPHLHFTMWHHDRLLNPMDVLW